MLQNELSSELIVDSLKPISFNDIPLNVVTTANFYCDSLRYSLDIRDSFD